MSHLAPLILLAAGLGSRFGGIKPLASVGPNGEPLLLVSLSQAADAGFDRAVIVVSPTTERLVREGLAATPIPCTFALQTTPQRRPKPLGTVDAALRAYDSMDVPVNAVVVANGDDLYGSTALRDALGWTMRVQQADRCTAAAVLYGLGATVPTGEHGGVSRAIVECDADARLVSITEHRAVRWEAGFLRSSATTAALSPDAVVSMNLWCLTDRAAEVLRAERDRVADSTDLDGEVGLPDAINRLVRGGLLRVDTMVTDSTWHGVTWADDVAAVRAALVGEVAAR